MTEPATQYRERQTPPSTSAGFTFYALVVLLFVLYSRALDFFPVPLVTMFVFIASLVATVLSGQVTRLFQSRISKLWIILAVWLALSTAMSIWRAGSWLTLNGWLKALSVYFVTVGLIGSVDQCFRAVRTIAWAVGTLAVLSFVYGNTTSGRFFVDAGKFQGPNELAQVLLLAVPFLCLLFSRSPRISVTRFAVLGVMAIVGVVLMHTGSRGGMVAAGAMALVALASARSKGMAAAVAAGALVIMIGALTLSEPLRTRYLTFFDSDVDEGTSKQTATMSKTASDSAEERWQLLQDSLAITLEHPLLGTGPGMFAELRERRAHSLRTHVPFLETHNSYTQLSSEGGIPAALLFIAIIVGCFRSAVRIQRLASKEPTKRMQDLAAMASAMKYSLLSFGISSIFLSAAYGSLLPTLAGLVVALEYTFRAELASRPSDRAWPKSRSATKAPGGPRPVPVSPVSSRFGAGGPAYRNG